MRKDKTDLVQLVKDKDDELVQVAPNPTLLKALSNFRL